MRDGLFDNIAFGVDAQVSREGMDVEEAYVVVAVR